MSDRPRKRRGLHAKISVTGMPELMAGYRRALAQILMEAIDEAVADEPPAVAARMRELALQVAATFETGLPTE